MSIPIKAVNKEPHIWILHLETDKESLYSAYTTMEAAKAELVQYAQAHWDEEYDGVMPEDEDELVDRFLGSNYGTTYRLEYVPLWDTCPPNMY